MRLSQEAILENGSDKLSLGTDLEWRKVPNPDSLDESYLFGNFALNGRTSLSPTLSLRGLVRGEGVRFTGEPASSYDYYRVQGKFGPSFTIGPAWFLDTRLSAGTRQAPDSALLSYKTFGGELTVASFGTGSSFDLFARGERKIVSPDALSGDLIRVITAASGRFPISAHLFGALESDWEWNDYSPDDPVNNDYGSIQGALLGGLEWGVLTLSAGPEMDLLWEVSEIEADEDYTEWGGRIEAELTSGTSLLASSSFAAGRRDLRFEDELRSDFTYGRFDLFGIWSISSALQLTALFSIDSEWSERKESNSTTSLVSSSLVYMF